MPSRHGHVCGVLPPYLLEQIARNGSPQQRDHALSTLMKDQTFRAARLHAAATQPANHRGADVLTAAAGGEPRRTISTADNTEQLPGHVVRAEGAPPSGDAAVDEAYDGFGATHALYWDVYQRNSIDDEGMPLDGIVHFGQAYDNAFWDGQRMIFGDGDGQLFNRFTISLDVIGHELTHGVTQDEARLVYFNQSGALNESISDVFGSLVK